MNETRIGYLDAARAVIAVDGWLGLFGRGLVTKWIANGLQGIMFSVLWQFFMDLQVFSSTHARILFLTFCIDGAIRRILIRSDIVYLDTIWIKLSWLPLINLTMVSLVCIEIVIFRQKMSQKIPRFHLLYRG